MSVKFSTFADTPSSLADHVYLFVRDQVVTFRIKPFSVVSEKKISTALGVSRTPVREALARLAAQRLIDIYPQRGTFVSPLRRPDLERSQFMRESLEVGLIQRVSLLPDRGELITRLRAEMDLQYTFAKIDDENRFYRSDEDFHRLIATYAGLPGIWQEILRSKIHMDRFRHLTLATVEKDVGVIATQHNAIVDAIEDGDPSSAAAVMRVHLRRILTLVDKVARIHPEFFETEDAVVSLDEAAD